MKVTLKGNLKKEVWKGECRDCGSRMEAVASELLLSCDPRDGTSVGQARCPECGNHTVNFYPTKE